MRQLKKYLSSQDSFVGNLYEQLVENFPQTFFVGGSVRDALLGKRSLDIDIATSATPEQTISLLNRLQITFSNFGMRFGVIQVLHKKNNIEIATFRKEKYGKSRYPAITYINNPKIDAKRRDFTINALYLQAKNGKLADYYSGLRDIEKRRLKFIGNPEGRIKEDPLRIVRALRFCLQLNFRMDKKTWLAILKNLGLTQTLTKKKIETEILKTNNLKKTKMLKEILFGRGPLDKVSKKFYYDFK